MPSKKCVVCGNEFEPKRPEYRTCGTTCRNRLIAAEKEARHTTVQPCEFCGKSFANTGKQRKRRTCSVECGKKLVGRIKDISVEHTCKTCGEAFMANPNRGAEYCSRKCMYARNDTARNCEVCGKEFRSPPSQTHVRTCSPACGGKIRVIPFGKGRTGRVTITCKNAAGKTVSRRTKAASGEHYAQRRAAHIRAMVKWADQQKIDAIYALAQNLSKATGMTHHVDHIVPLISKRVCGLHNEFNLQVLPGPDNLKKGNRSWPDM